MVMRKAIVVIAALLFLAWANIGIYGKEQLLAKGRVVLLELAPVDPRSLVQGDYMALRFRAADEAFGAGTDKRRIPGDGRLVLSSDERGVAAFKGFDDGTPLSAREVVIRYRIRGGQPRFATNAFFFQEGHAGLYTDARFGEFRVDDKGECILTGLRDGKLKKLGPPTGG
ncbi:MAG: GDYXXLXY domain-containing protein [Thermodesulfovibrionales bacterium]